MGKDIKGEDVLWRLGGRACLLLLLPFLISALGNGTSHLLLLFVVFLTSSFIAGPSFTVFCLLFYCVSLCCQFDFVACVFPPPDPWVKGKLGIFFINDQMARESSFQLQTNLTKGSFHPLSDE